MSVVELVQRLTAREAVLCFRLNAGRRRPALGRLLAIASRLGDGIFWYALMVAMLLIGGEPLRAGVGRMAVTGAVTTVIYLFVKHRIGRPRPCDAYPALEAIVAPLDRFSFPSGHTMHSVCFTILATGAVPALGLVLVPFSGLVMLSRVAIGLHYPSDVLAGALGGAAAACVALALS